MTSSSDPTPIIYLTLFRIPSEATQTFERAIQANREAMSSHTASLGVRILRSVSAPSEFQYIIESKWASEEGFHDAWDNLHSNKGATPPLPEGAIAQRVLFEEVLPQEVAR